MSQETSRFLPVSGARLLAPGAAPAKSPLSTPSTGLVRLRRHSQASGIFPSIRVASASNVEPRRQRLRSISSFS